MKGAAAAARAAGCTLESASLVAASKVGEAAAAGLVLDLDGSAAEVQVRLQAMAPALAEHVQAGAEHRAPQLSGAMRATRNVAAHWCHGAGVVALE
eukprot:9831748-Lingulodinium_polyedra.AAC.1